MGSDDAPPRSGRLLLLPPLLHGPHPGRRNAQARARLLPEAHAEDGHHAVVPFSRSQARQRCALDEGSRRYAPAHRPQLGRQLSPRLGGLVRPADGSARGFRDDGDLLLHARLPGRKRPPHLSPDASGSVRGILRAHDRTLRAGRAGKSGRMSRHDPQRTDINVAIVGVGNCASSLVQVIAHYQNGGANEQIGLMHWDLGGYRPKDINIVAAWDVDRRKAGRDVAEAILAKPNCTAIFCDHVPQSNVTVEMGHVLDGYSEHMSEWPDDRTF